MESGLLEELKQSLTYVLPDELEDRGEKKGKIEIAKPMIKDNEPICQNPQICQVFKKRN